MNPPVFIISRDRLTGMTALLDWCETAGLERITIIDNASTWPPLLDYLDAQHAHKVIRPGVNLGHKAVWRLGLQPDEPYVVTDPDVLPTKECPLDVADHLHDLLDAYPAAVKTGLGLVIDDLPDHYAHAPVVRRWEAQFTAKPVPGGFEAPLDTTFAMYRAGAPYGLSPAIRTAAPYLARHLPWYENSAHPSAETLHYRQHADPLISHWSQAVLPARLSDAL